MMDISGKTALVTGGAKRLGRAASFALARNGVNVVVHFASAANEAEELAQALEREGVRSWTIQTDLASPANAESLFAKTIAAAGACDFLINNASMFPDSTFAGLDAGEVQANVDLNALAPTFLARALGRSGTSGCVINMLDCMIADYDKKHLAYHLSKRMLHTLTRIMAVELAPRIRVNAVAPGLVLPPVGKDESYLADLASSNLLNRYGGPADVAEAVLFLLRSDFVTGQILYVDGGRNLRGNMYGG